MLSKLVIILAAFIVGMIASEDVHDFDSNELTNFDTEINGDLQIQILNSNKNQEIPHKLMHLDTLKLHKNVDGVLHYALGARTSST